MESSKEARCQTVLSNAERAAQYCGLWLLGWAVGLRRSLVSSPHLSINDDVGLRLSWSLGLGLHLPINDDVELQLSWSFGSVVHIFLYPGRPSVASVFLKNRYKSWFSEF